MSKVPLILILKLLISIFLISILLYWLEWDQALETIREAEVTWLLLASILILLVVLLDGLRLYWMVPVHHMKLSGHLRLALQSAFVMQLGFGVISGEAYRTTVYAFESGKILKPAVHIIAARIAGIFSVGFIALGISLWVLYVDNENNQQLMKNIIKAVVIFSLTTLLFYSGLMIVIKKKLIAVPDWGITALDALKRITLKVWILSLIMVLMRGFSFACVLYSISQLAPLHVPFFASIVATLSTLLPFALGGLGVREGALAGTVALFGTPYVAAMSAAIIMRFLMIIVCAIGLLLSFSFPDSISHKSRNNNSVNPE